MNFKRLIFLISLAALMLIAACGSDDEESNGSNGDEGNSGAEYSEAVDYTITAIEPGAGITVTSEKAAEEYDQLSGWTVEQSSTAAMITELQSAVDNEEPIVVTGWNPHWMFTQFPDLKYLDDPQGVYGEAENIESLARLGLEEDSPNAYQVVEQFNWDVEDMEQIMYEAQDNDEEIMVAAERWVEENQDKVDEWIDGVEEGSGESITLASTPWDSERASSSVIQLAMESIGIDVEVTPVDVAVVFESVANGDADATIAAWLPYTHSDFYESVEDDVEHLGANLEGAKIGLSVPGYMDIDSIEDLEPAE